jgi:hypothetical protein
VERHRLNWEAAAVVPQGEAFGLAVELVGAVGSRWADTFTATVQRDGLRQPPHPWDEISLTGSTIEVSGFEGFASRELRQYVEQLVVLVDRMLAEQLAEEERTRLAAEAYARQQQESANALQAWFREGDEPVTDAHGGTRDEGRRDRGFRWPSVSLDQASG